MGVSPGAREHWSAIDDMRVVEEKLPNKGVMFLLAVFVFTLMFWVITT